MSNKDEALKLALEALERVDAIERGMVTTSRHHYQAKEDTTKAITAIKEALAQPEQEPVYLAWFYEEETNGGWFETTKDHYDITDEEDRWLLYPAPPKREWVGLTEEQFLEAARLAEDGNYLVAFQRIHQWLREKNT